MAELKLYMIGARIAQYRKRDRLRQYALAERAGLHPVTLSRIEHGQLPGLTLAVLWRIAAVFKVPVAYLWEEGYDIPRAWLVHQAEDVTVTVTDTDAHQAQYAVGRDDVSPRCPRL